jgi:ABC-type sugar transport system permease subunit
LSTTADKLFHFQHRYAPYIFVAPFIVLFCTFGLYPLVKSVVLSLYATSGPKSQLFVGLDNFRFLLQDPSFLKAVRNTAVFAACSVFLQLPLSLGLALLVNYRFLRGRNFFRLCFFSPNLVGMVFVGVLFAVIFAAPYGLLNVGLNRLFGMSLETGWLDNPNRVMPALVLTSLWMYVGFNMVYFLAALQGVDLTLYEAATVDGADAFQRFWHVTLPSIQPVAVFVIVLSTIGSFQLFELPYLMLQNGPGPDEAGLTIVMYLYQNGFITGDLGYASAIGWTLALGVLVLAVVQMYLSGSWKKEA